MRVIAVKALRNFWRQTGRGDSQQPLKAWYREAKRADWATPSDVKAMYRSAGVIGDNRVVFNIAGNKYRLVVKFNYPYRVADIRFVCTHAEYDRIDAETI